MKKKSHLNVNFLATAVLKEFGLTKAHKLIQFIEERNHTNVSLVTISILKNVP